MKNPILEARLLHIKAWLYFSLMLLVGILAFVIFNAMTNVPANPEPVFFCGTPSGIADAEFNKGKELFAANCQSCHHKNMKDRLTGPALGGTRQRWSAYPEKDLYDFIRTSQRMIRKGHPRAKELWKEYRPARMNNFKKLTDADIEALLVFIGS